MSQTMTADDRGELHVGRPTWAAVDLDALAHNFRVVRESVGAGAEVMCVLKADAYGHGAVECARRLASEGATWFGVALPEEAVKLRDTGVAQPILCFDGFWEGQAESCLRYDLTPVVFRLDVAEAFDAVARAAGVVRNVHVKIDTGMGRLGVRCDDTAEFAERLRACKHLKVDGLMTHFAAADEPARDSFTAEQIKRFREAVAQFRGRGHAPTYEHLSNSAGALAHPEAGGNMVRPGGVLYGLWRDVLPHGCAVGPQLRPVMSLRTRVTLVKSVRAGETLGYGRTFEVKRESRVATLPLGYHDGYPRALSNRGRVVVRGQAAPVVGRVSMDLTMVDVTDVAGVEVGDQVVLFGAGGAPTAEEVAREAGTISYEVTCGVSARVPRVCVPRGE